MQINAHAHVLIQIPDIATARTSTVMYILASLLYPQKLCTFLVIFYLPQPIMLLISIVYWSILRLSTIPYIISAV